MRRIKFNELSLWYVLIVIIVLYFLSIFLLYWLFGPWESGSDFGDTLGAINTLFAGLAFGGIIYTIFLQREELVLQRKDLELTRDELRGQKEEFITQNQTLNIQRFENTFFQLITLHHKIVDNIDLIETYRFNSSIKLIRSVSINPSIENRERLVYGRDVFMMRYIDMKDELAKHSTVIRLSEVYSKHYELFQTDVGHYFRNLYRIIKFVDSSDIADKYTYTSIIRAQLSDYELLWLFYNCISDKGKDKFKPLIEKYTLFKNLPSDKLADSSSHKSFYNESAFTRS